MLTTALDSSVGVESATVATVAIAPPALIMAAATAIEATRRLRARALARRVSTAASGRYDGMSAMNRCDDR